MTDGWKRLHVLPRRYWRHGVPGQTFYEELQGPWNSGLETAAQRHIRKESLRRYLTRTDAYTPPDSGLLRGEIGHIDGFRFISSPAPAVSYRAIIKPFS